MSTWKGNLLTVTFTLHNGDEIEVKDTSRLETPARAAFDQFKRYEIIKLEGAGDAGADMYVPFHSVLKVEVGSEAATETYDDEMCVSPTTP